MKNYSEIIQNTLYVSYKGLLSLYLETYHIHLTYNIPHFSPTLPTVGFKRLLGKSHYWLIHHMTMKSFSHHHQKSTLFFSKHLWSI